MKKCSSSSIRYTKHSHKLTINRKFSAINSKFNKITKTIIKKLVRKRGKLTGVEEDCGMIGVTSNNNVGLWVDLMLVLYICIGLSNSYDMRIHT